MQVSLFHIANKLITGKDALFRLKEEVDALHMTNPIIVTDEILQKAGVTRKIEEQLSGLPFGVFNGVKPEPELEIVAHCVKVIEEGKHDGVIAVGGGSVIDIGKCSAAVSYKNVSIEQFFGVDLLKEKGLPLIAVPTTAGTGSEVTNVAVLTDTKEQLKKGVVSACLLPDVALVSPEMTVTCPPSVTAASGIDALVHAIEAYISLYASPITDALAIKAMNMIANYLPKAYANPHDLTAREQMATASLMAGMAFGNAGTAAVHALAYPLGGRYHITHGVSNSLLLPYVMKWNKIACLEKFRDIAEALGEDVKNDSLHDAADKAIAAMTRLCRYVKIPSSLREFNIPEEAIKEMAVDASKVTRLLKNNPRVLSVADIEEIYRAAY